ncbi:MAG: hypothetical protein WCL02_05045 [bacterium]
MIDNNPPSISIQTIANGAYRVTTAQDLKFFYNDRQGGGNHYKYVTTTYSNVTAGNYVTDTTGDNQYGVNSGTITIKI